MAFSLRSALASLALVCVLFVAVAPTAAVADVPSNCTYDDFLGTWAVTLSSVLPPPSYPSLNCNFSWDAEDHFNVSFAAPNTGLYAGAGMSWTLIYNQGIEIWAGSVVHFAFSNYDAAGNSLCQSTSVGYFHTTDLEEWRCVSMKKIADAEDSPAALARAQAPTVSASEQAERAKERELAAERAYDPERLNTVFTTDHAFLAKVNEAAAGMFTVKHYPELDGMTIGQLERRRGSAYAHEMASTPQAMGVPPALLTHEEAHRTPQQLKDVPDNFDWRNVSGVNYVSPVRDQGQCGSCYIFSSAGQLEARIRIKSGNTQQPILSTQDAVDCSSYSQGCDGGFPYLLAGKYGFDYGFTEEACNTYKGVDGVCQINSTDSCSNRWKTDSYQYVGGYYGASTMERMQREIMANGPISVGFFVYDEFMHYAGGVYTHQFAADLQLDDYNPFVLVNHAVLMVGWGVTDDDKKTPYWIVKNSWSEKWGEQGFFRILRSSDESMGGECGIQSLSVSASPVLH